MPARDECGRLCCKWSLIAAGDSPEMVETVVGEEERKKRKGREKPERLGVGLGWV